MWYHKTGREEADQQSCHKVHQTLRFMVKKPFSSLIVFLNFNLLTSKHPENTGQMWTNMFFSYFITNILCHIKLRFLIKEHHSMCFFQDFSSTAKCSLARRLSCIIRMNSMKHPLLERLVNWCKCKCFHLGIIFLTVWPDSMNYKEHQLKSYVFPLT